jgi:gamma-glutamyltranspeptidase/glutathione hydrolase
MPPGRSTGRSVVALPSFESNGRTSLVAGVLAVAAALFFAAPAPAQKPAAPTVSHGKVGVATENRIATEAALAELRAGGNAVDAAVTATLVGGIVSPTSSGLGGGGFALVRMADGSKPFFLDFREIAPAQVDAAALDERKIPPEQRGRLVGVPGEPAGLFALHQRFGKRPWKDVVLRAERLARGGFPVEKHLAAVLGQRNAEAFKRDAGLASLYYPGGKPAIAGQLLSNPKLAGTLRRLAAEGPKAIYEGAIAADLVKAAESAGGKLSLEDLKAYAPREREPLHVTWEGNDVYTAPPPSAGGLLVAQLLSLFSQRELEAYGLRTGLSIHYVAEAMRGAFADRARFVGDPDAVPVDISRLLSPEHLGERKRRISADRTHLRQRFIPRESGTHHLIAVDASENVVSLTTTVNTAFGAELTGTSSGIVLNDELDDFTAASVATELGISDNPNRARAKARPVSSMTPTIVVKGGRPVLAIGGSGGPAIPMNVAQVLLARLAFGEAPDKAVSAPRFLLAPAEVTLRVDTGFSPEVLADLAYRGELTKALEYNPTAVQLVVIEPAGVLAAADPRKSGRGSVE